jgi:hypothetical protein
MVAAAKNYCGQQYCTAFTVGGRSRGRLVYGMKVSSNLMTWCQAQDNNHKLQEMMCM